MTYEKFMTVIQDDVEKILKDNSVNIAQRILEDIDEPMSKEQLQIIRNSVTVSVQLSAQIIFDYLTLLGIIDCRHYSEHHERPVLKVIQGGHTESDNE